MKQPPKHQYLDRKPLVFLVCFSVLKVLNEIPYTFAKILVPTMVFLRFYFVFYGFRRSEEGEGELDEGGGGGDIPSAC